MEQMTADAFWEFSVDRYARDGVSKVCLDLQDVFGVDVNMLLLCLWCGQAGLALTTDQLSQLIQGEAGQWHRDIVLPLRSARRSMKGRSIAGEENDIEEFRSQLKTIEIESERWQQRSLAAAVAALFSERMANGPAASSSELAMQNAERYINLVLPVGARHPRGLLTELVEACIN